MAKSLDKVLQPDGTYKWELVEPTASEKMGNGPEAPVVCPAPATLVPGELGISESAPEKGVLKGKATKKKTAKKKSTSPLSD